MIPRVVHQTGVDPLSNDAQQSRQSLSKVNRTWKHEFWDNTRATELVNEMCGSWFDTWDSIPNTNIIKWDVFRYMLLYVHGGLYVDIDTVFHKPLDDIIDINHELILIMKHGDFRWVKNHFMLAAPNSNFMKQAVEHVLQLPDSVLSATHACGDLVHAQSGGELLYNLLCTYTGDVHLLPVKYVANVDLLWEAPRGEQLPVSYVNTFDWNDVHVTHLVKYTWYNNR